MTDSNRQNRRRFSTKGLLVPVLMAILATTTLVACAGSFSRPHSGIIVPSEPPLPQFETATQKSEDAAVWVPGFWDWSEREATWRWVSGRWEVPPRPGAVWVPPSHVRQGHGWVLTRGGWK